MRHRATAFQYSSESGPEKQKKAFSQHLIFLKAVFSRRNMSLNAHGRLATFVTSSEVRSKVLIDLSKGPKTTTELASMEGKHVSHVSRALAELRAEGLVEPFWTSSRSIYYRATDEGISLSYLFLNKTK